jgi:hypothetical protein
MKTTSSITHFALDTSFIEGQNFLAGKQLYHLASLGRKEAIKVYITDIIYREVISRFENRLIEEEKKIESVKKTIESHVRVLKNFEDYTAYFTLPEIATATLMEKFQLEFDAWIKSAKVKILKTDGLTIGKVMNDYFLGNVPFGQGKKKQEFPDAFTLQALESFFSMGKVKCYFITSDFDFNQLESEYIIPTNDLSEKLDVIIRKEDRKEGALKLIETTFLDAKTTLEKDAAKLLYRFIEEEVESKGELRGMEIDVLDYLEVADIVFEDYKIVYLDENSANLECTTKVSYEATIVLEDNSYAFYDKESGQYIGTNYTHFEIEDSKELVFNIRVSYDIDEEYATIEVDDIENGLGFDFFDGWEEDFY